MGKVVLFLVVFFAILFVLRMLSVAKTRRDRKSGSERRDAPPPSAAMVRCAECGVFLPKAEALPSPRGYRCGDPRCAHRGDA
jgi:uncharacterized protein